MNEIMVLAVRRVSNPQLLTTHERLILGEYVIFEDTIVSKDKSYLQSSSLSTDLKQINTQA